MLFFRKHDIDTVNISEEQLVDLSAVMFRFLMMVKKLLFYIGSVIESYPLVPQGDFKSPASGIRSSKAFFNIPKGSFRTLQVSC